VPPRELKACQKRKQLRPRQHYPREPRACRRVARIRIFTGTWNMAEIQPPSNLGSAWIDRSCDVVAIGLQECMHLNQALSAVRSHLGPGFLEISHSIGSTTKTLGFHGHIVLGVWVREWLSIFESVPTVSRREQAPFCWVATCFLHALRTKAPSQSLCQSVYHPPLVL